MSLVRIVGALDPHVHLRGMEWAHKGDFATETAAALAGGYTAVLDMPNTPPPTTDSQGLERKLEDLGRNARCDYGVWLGAHPSGVRPPAELARLSRRVCGIKLYCGHTTGGLTIGPSQMDRQVASWPGPGVLAAHAEGESVSVFLAALARYGKRGHLCHIDTARAVSEVAEHKRRGTKVTAGVCPHHLVFCDRDLPALGPRGMMKPPLGTRSDREALWEGLRQGVIDVVESDHAPHTWDEKLGHPHALRGARVGNHYSPSVHRGERGTHHRRPGGRTGVGCSPPHLRSGSAPAGDIHAGGCWGSVDYHPREPLHFMRVDTVFRHGGVWNDKKSRYPGYGGLRGR